jgi:hypothetical protein
MDPRLNLALKLIGVVAVVAVAYGVIAAATAIGDDSASGGQAVAPTATAEPSPTAARPALNPDTPVSNAPPPAATVRPNPPAQPPAPTATPNQSAAAGGGTQLAEPLQTPTPAPGRETVLAPIDAMDILVRESFPPGYTVNIQAGLPSGCAQKAGFDHWIDGDTVHIRVWNSMPSGAVACTQIYGMYEVNVDIGTAFQSGRQYRVEVNEQRRATFTAQ